MMEKKFVMKFMGIKTVQDVTFCTYIIYVLPLKKRAICQVIVWPQTIFPHWRVED